MGERTAEEYEEILRGYAELDWLVAGRWTRLHSPASASYDSHEWCALDVTMACGWQVEQAFIPGLGSRLSVPRCAYCCSKVGLPRGTGSPKNDQECRIILGIPCTKIQPEYDGPYPIPVCQLPTAHEGEHEYIRDLT